MGMNHVLTTPIHHMFWNVSSPLSIHGQWSYEALIIFGNTLCLRRVVGSGSCLGILSREQHPQANPRSILLMPSLVRRSNLTRWRGLIVPACTVQPRTCVEVATWYFGFCSQDWDHPEGAAVRPSIQTTHKGRL
jgi:hypothetical protein